MIFSCKDTFTFLYGDTCRRIAYKETRSAPAVDPDDVLQQAATNLWQRLLNANGPCPTPKDCPLNRGRGTSLCPFPVDDYDVGERYVKRVVLNTARRLRRAGTRPRNTEVDRSSEAADDPILAEKSPRESSRERVDWPEGDARILENASVRASQDDNPLNWQNIAEFLQWAPKLLDRLHTGWDRIAGGEPPHHVFPTIGGTKKVQEILTAAAHVLRLEARNPAEGLRMADPHFYGSLEAGAPIENSQAQNTTRHGRIVDRIVWQIWKAEMGDEA